jgi:hypothetical protein
MPTKTNKTPAKRRASGVGSGDLVRLLKGCAYELWCASLCAGPQSIRSLFDELRSPKVGDLVMETTTHMMESRDPLEGIGTLVAVGEAPYYATRAEARAAGYEDDEPLPTRQVWDIKLDFDDGRIFRWENASFIKVKTARSEPNAKIS